jgi:hypothetical protein
MGTNKPRTVGCGPIVNKGIENKIRTPIIVKGPLFDAIKANVKPAVQPSKKKIMSIKLISIYFRIL